MSKEDYSIYCEADLEVFLNDLEQRLKDEEAGTLRVTIPHERWIEIIFDCVEADTRYQIDKDTDPFLDLVFIHDYPEGDEPSFTNESAIEFLEDLLKQLEDLDEGDEDNER